MSQLPVSMLAERAVVRHFVAAGAVSMADAIAYVPVRAGHRRAVARLTGLDVLKTDGKGKWWLDEAQWRQRRSRRRTRAVLALIAVGAAAVAATLR